VGTVAEETARLVELLSGYAAVAGSRARSADGRPPAGDADASAAPGSGPDDSFAGSTTGAGPDDSFAGSTGSSTGSAAECTCGGPAACRICPVCQLIAFVQRIDPEAVDRLAEVVELAATGLRDLATAQRGRREQDRRERPDSQ
jgi:hypothetical protein